MKELANAQDFAQRSGWQVAEDVLPDLYGKTAGAVFVVLGLGRQCKGSHGWPLQKQLASLHMDVRDRCVKDAINCQSTLVKRGKHHHTLPAGNC